jgi:hypothetical protein
MLKYLVLVILTLLYNIAHAEVAPDLQSMIKQFTAPRDATPASEKKSYNPVFVVRNVAIYAESNTLDNAQIEAVNNGIQASYRVVLERILPIKDRWRIDNIRFGEIFRSVHDVELSDERFTSNSYKATATFYYDHEALKKLLYGQGVFFTSQYSEDYLVIPILCSAGLCSATHDNNWDEAWGSLPAERGLLKLKYLLNDLQDDNIIDYSNIMSKNFQDFAALAKRYKTQYFIIVEAVVQPNGLKIRLKHLSPDNEMVFESVYSSKDYETVADMYRVVSYNALDDIDTFYKNNRQK